jgi:uncharacterized membrane protein YbaN (DUF454 family)
VKIKHFFIKGAIKIVGLIFIALGIAGLFLPFLQGILFIIIGFIFLSFTSPAIKSFIDGHLAKFPKIRLIYDRQYQKLSVFLNKLSA